MAKKHYLQKYRILRRRRTVMALDVVAHAARNNITMRRAAREFPQHLTRAHQAAGERNCCIQLPKLGHQCYNRQVVKTKDTYILLGLGLLLTGAWVVPLSTLDAILDLADNVRAGYD